MTPPITLTIAGSDCSSGAGIQADLKTFSHHGCHGLTAISCVVAETPKVVSSIHPVPPSILQEQIELLLNAYPIQAIKTGMLPSQDHLIAVVNALSNSRNIPLVIDPVMVSSSGSNLVDQHAIVTYREKLLPLASLITPNLPEASVLLDQAVESENDLVEAAQKLSELYNTSILLKGGHLPGKGDRVDTLYHNGTIHQFTSPLIDIACTHGTGCTLSAAIVSHLARERNMVDAISESIKWLHNAIKTSYQWNSPSGETIHCLNHLIKESS